VLHFICENLWETNPSPENLWEINPASFYYHMFPDIVQTKTFNMKLITTIKNSALQLCALVMLSFLSVQSFAQDKKVDISINSDKGGSSNWYTQPWVWILGAAVFILLLVAIIRGGGRRD